MRNKKTEWCVSHHQLAAGMNLGNGRWVGGCKKRIALTATPVFHAPGDMVGLCHAINTSPEFQQLEYWSLDKQGTTINPAAVKAFKKHTDRVKDDILNLPAIHQQTLNYAPGMLPDEVVAYNTHLQNAQRLRMRMEQSKLSTKDLQKLMLLMQRMQQTLISPRLAETGADYFKKNVAEITRAATRHTGALTTLYDHICHLQDNGHARVMVACNHVVLMRIAKAYMEREAASGHRDVGKVFIYDGHLTLPQRQAERKAFLEEKNAVLLLSIGAGGTGLHVVPKAGVPKTHYCRACIFWGSRPFSPQQVKQTMKRIHRIGQVYEVFVTHLISKGSVDYAINCVHQDKSGLANAITDDDWSNCDEVGGNWRKTGRIVDNCSQMAPDGTFMDTARPVVMLPPSATAAAAAGLAGAQAVGQSLASQFFRPPVVKIEAPGSPGARAGASALAASASASASALGKRPLMLPTSSVARKKPTVPARPPPTGPPDPPFVRVRTANGTMTLPTPEARRLGYTIPSTYQAGFSGPSSVQPPVRPVTAPPRRALPLPTAGGLNFRPASMQTSAPPSASALATQAARMAGASGASGANAWALM